MGATSQKGQQLHPGFGPRCSRTMTAQAFLSVHASLLPAVSRSVRPCHALCVQIPAEAMALGSGQTAPSRVFPERGAGHRCRAGRPFPLRHQVGRLAAPQAASPVTGEPKSVPWNVPTLVSTLPWGDTGCPPLALTSSPPPQRQRRPLGPGPSAPGAGSVSRAPSSPHSIPVGMRLGSSKVKSPGF